MDDDENQDQHVEIKKAGKWAFWTGIVLFIVGLVILVIIIGRMYYKLGSVKPPPACYISTKDMKVAKQAKDYLGKFENKKLNMGKFLCKKCAPCAPCPEHPSKNLTVPSISK